MQDTTQYYDFSNVIYVMTYLRVRGAEDTNVILISLTCHLKLFLFDLRCGHYRHFRLTTDNILHNLYLLGYVI